MMDCLARWVEGVVVALAYKTTSGAFCHAVLGFWCTDDIQGMRSKQIALLSLGAQG